MRTASAIQSIEKETASLYTSCFERLNEWTDESWIKQGEMLFQNLGLTSEKVEGKKCMDGGCGHGTLSYQLLAQTLTEEESKRYRDVKTVCTYDPRDFTSKILFGYGFIVVEGMK